MKMYFPPRQGFRDRVSLCSLVCLRHSVKVAGLKLKRSTSLCLPNAGINGVNHCGQLDRDVCVRGFCFLPWDRFSLTLLYIAYNSMETRLDLNSQRCAPPSALIKDVHHTAAIVFLRQDLILAQSNIDIFGNSMHSNSLENILLTSCC